MLEHYEFAELGVKKQHFKQLMFPTTRGKNTQYFTLTTVVYEIILLVSFTQKQSSYFSITVIKVKGKGVPMLNHAHAMKAYEEVEVQCHTFLILAPNER